jgi:hypothetical protein
MSTRAMYHIVRMYIIFSTAYPNNPLVPNNMYGDFPTQILNKKLQNLTPL